MSKKQFKSQASSGRAASPFRGAFGTSGFGTTQSSVLSYVQEPPDFLRISDANVVVAFKNLLKKDGTTKAKALEDLDVYVTSSSQDIEEAFLETWAKLFPRLSIDSSRRVRQLSHNLNGHTCAKSGRRTARHMPRISGPWLAGTFDSDRNVARAALDALSLVFPTPDKVLGVRKAFQRPILEYCRDAALHETVKTLSDERIVSSDDAEATYARVVATSLSVLMSLLQELNKDLVAKEIHLYQEIFANVRLWESVHHSDAGVRRSVHRLVRTCLENQASLIQDNVKIASSAYIYKGLHSDQAGSALDFIQTLESLTLALPTIWTEAYSGKKSALSRFRHFLKLGSQSSTSAYWESLSNLLRVLPAPVLPSNKDDAADLFSAARTGVSRREDRFNVSAAWPAYFTLADVVTSPMDDADANAVLETNVMPVLRQYLFPTPETTDWTIAGAKSAWTVSQIAITRKAIPLVVSEWQILTEKLIEMAKMSQPEQSKDFDKSQRHVASTGERWADLQRELWITNSDDALAGCFKIASNETMQACIGLLKTRNGKPYGAAAIIGQLLRTCSERLMEDGAFRHAYTAFAELNMPDMMFGPSQRHLTHGLYAINSNPAFSEIFTIVLKGITTAAEPDTSKFSALRTIFTIGMPTEAVLSAKQTSEFQEFLMQSLSTAGSVGADSLFTDLIKLGAVTTETTDAILSKLVGTLTTSNEMDSVLSAMDVLTRSNQSMVQTFISTAGGSGEQLLPSLLKLEQSPNDEVAAKAASLSSQLSTAISETTSDAKYAMVLQYLEHTSETSLPLDAVQELVNRLLGPTRKIQSASEIIPSVELWLSALRRAIKPPRPSMALLSPLGGAVHLLPRDVYPSDSAQFDAEGFSQAFRISTYVARLLTETDLLQHLSDMRATIIALLHISVLVAQDNLSITGMNEFWSVKSGQEGESAALEFISEANKILSEYWKAIALEVDSTFAGDLGQLWEALKNLRKEEVTSLSYYASLSYIDIHENIVELRGFSTAEAKASESVIKELRSTKQQTLRLVEEIVALQQTLSGNAFIERFYNEIIAELTDLDIVGHEERGFEQLVILNSILRTQAGITATVAKQRLIFFIKRLIGWLDASILPDIRVETCKALVELLPSIHDIYGEHWEQILSFLVVCWSSTSMNGDNKALLETDVLLMHASLKLFGVLRKPSKYEEPNEDLVDVMKEQEGEIRDGLIHLLESSDGVRDDTNQPLMITHELLARQLVSLPRKPLKVVEGLYPLMYTPSRSLVQAAFELLHCHIPLAQEQISFDAALENKTAQLPDELLSLVLEAPTLESLAEANFDRMMPLPLQGYLYSWRLLFDHFDGSSYKVKNDYIEQLKEGTYLDGLLDLAFDFLGHTRGKPVNVSKFDILLYVADSEPSPEKDVQWLLTHLYYLALTHLPSLVKSYYLNVRSRQTSATIESWTAKHISPLIINASLEGVAEWADKSVKDDPEYEKMSVKVGMRSKEIYVSYIVDEQTMAIKVVLPDAYPLTSAQVIGVSRVAVKEEKWQSWLRNCQGVITFSNGSIIDGLTAWRKNVTGALKGQTECAICYSIISADKQLPTKRCPTCKNLFHSSCLLKWFKTSNASTCPLCRNPFNFN